MSNIDMKDSLILIETLDRLVANIFMDEVRKTGNEEAIALSIDTYNIRRFLKDKLNEALDIDDDKTMEALKEFASIKANEYVSKLNIIQELTGITVLNPTKIPDENMMD